MNRKTLSDMQDEQARQMRSAQGKSRTEAAAKEMSSAASSLSSAAVQQNQSYGMLVQTIQSQQNQIQTLTNNLNMMLGQMRMESAQSAAYSHQSYSPAPRHGYNLKGVVQPVTSAVAGVAGYGLGNLKAGLIEPAMGTASAFGGRMIHGTDSAIGGAQPGYLSFPNQSLMSAMGHSMGLSYDPRYARSFTSGAFQRGMAREAGYSAQDVSQGVMNVGLDMLTSMPKDILGGTIGNALLPGLGALLGPQLTANIPDPFSHGARLVDRVNKFGAAANSNSYKFLRGRQGNRTGAFNYGEEAKIGRLVDDMTAYDMSYGENEISYLQEQFANTGHMLGAKNPDQYASKFKKLLSEHKQISKMLQLTTEEAVQMMEQLDYQSGLGSKNMGRIYAAAHMSGLSPQQVTQGLLAGSRQGVSMGLSAGMGSNITLGAMGTAGKLATSGRIGDNLFSTVGGEQGMQDIIKNAQMQYMSGTGGLLMAGGGTGVSGGLRGISQKFNSQGSIIDLMANRHELNDGKNTYEIQAHMATTLFDMAKKIDPKASGKRLKNIMQLLAVQQGFAKSPAESRVFVESMSNILPALNEETRLRSQASADQRKDAINERFGLRGRFHHAYEGFMRNYGGTATRDIISKSSAYIGQSMENMMLDAGDWMTGTQGQIVSSDIADKAVGSKVDYTTGGKSGVIGSDLSSKVKDALSGNSASAKFYRDILGRSGNALSSDVSNSNRNVNKTAVLNAIKEGVVISDEAELERYMQLRTGRGKGANKTRGDRGFFDVDSNQWKNLASDEELGGMYDIASAQMGIEDRSFQKSLGLAPSSLSNRAISMDKAAKIARQLTGAGSDMRDKQVVSAFNDKDFKAFADALREAYAADRQRTQKDSQGFERIEDKKKARRLKIIAAEKYAALKESGNPDVISLADSLMDQNGASINDGIIEFSHSFFTNPTIAGVRLKDRNYLTADNSYISQKNEAVKTSQIAQAQRDFLGTSLGALSGSTGSDSFDEFGGLYDPKTKSIASGSLANATLALSKDDLGKMSKGTDLEKAIARLRDKFEKQQLNKQQLDQELRKQLIKHGRQTGEILSGEGALKLAKEKGVIGQPELQLQMNAQILKLLERMEERLKD